MVFRKKESSSKKIVVKATTTYDDIKFAEMMKDENVYNNNLSQGQESGDNIQFSGDDDDDNCAPSMKQYRTIEE